MLLYGIYQTNETTSNNLTLYCMTMPFDAFEIYYVLETIMENAPFSIIFSEEFKTLPKFSLNFFQLC